MAYATIDDLIARLGKREIIDLTDRTGSGVVDTAAVDQALTDACAEIDGYLAARYQLPLPTVPTVLTRLTCDIAVYRLMTLRRMGDVEDARRRYEDVIRLLERIASGRVALGLPAALPDASRPQLSMAAARSGSAGVFSADEMGGW